MTKNFFGYNALERLPHPFCSLDISSPDFDLFRKVRRGTIGREILDEAGLCESVTEILNGISSSELQRGKCEGTGTVQLKLCEKGLG
jgi:hypothetical protein